MSFVEQLVHQADNIVWHSSTYLGENPKTRSYEVPVTKLSKAEIIQEIVEAYDFALNQIELQDPATLTKVFDWRGGKMDKIQFLNLIQDLQTHPRGQLIGYLRLKQIKPPAYRGW